MILNLKSNKILLFFSILYFLLLISSTFVINSRPELNSGIMIIPLSFVFLAISFGIFSGTYLLHYIKQKIFEKSENELNKILFISLIPVFTIFLYFIARIQANWIIEGSVGLPSKIFSNTSSVSLAIVIAMSFIVLFTIGTFFINIYYLFKNRISINKKGIAFLLLFSFLFFTALFFENPFFEKHKLLIASSWLIWINCILLMNIFQKNKFPIFTISFNMWSIFGICFISLLTNYGMSTLIYHFDTVENSLCSTISHEITTDNGHNETVYKDISQPVVFLSDSKVMTFDYNLITPTDLFSMKSIFHITKSEFSDFNPRFYECHLGVDNSRYMTPQEIQRNMLVNEVLNLISNPN